MDLVGAEEGLARLRDGLARQVIPISAPTGKGVPELIALILHVLEELKSQPEKEPPPEL